MASVSAQLEAAAPQAATSSNTASAHSDENPRPVAIRSRDCPDAPGNPAILVPRRGFIDKLPPEIRILIYGHVFGPSEVVRHTPGVDASLYSDDSDSEYHYSDSDDDYSDSDDDYSDSGDYPSNSDDDGPHAIDINIFLVNRQISTEAIEAFYKQKIIRACPAALTRLLGWGDFRQLVERIQMVEFAIYSGCHLPYTDNKLRIDLAKTFSSFLETDRLELPRLQHVSILYDKAKAGSGYSDTEFEKPTLRDILTSWGCKTPQPPMQNLKCVDIGRYTCGLENVDIISSELLKMWPNVKTTPANYSVMDEIQQYFDTWGCADTIDPAAVTFASQTSLRCWVALYRASVEFSSEDPAEPVRIGDTEHDRDLHSRALIRHARLKNASLSFWSDKNVKPNAYFADETQMCKLHELGPESDSQILEWATEFLMMNIYNRNMMLDFDEILPNPGEEDRYGECYRRPIWAELDGGEHEGADYISKTQEAYGEDGSRLGYRLKKPGECIYMYQSVPEWAT